MRKYQSFIAILGGLGLASMSSAAFAGGCGNYGAPSMNCSPSVVVNNTTPRFDPMTVNIRQPMGHLRSVSYSRAPHVSITRIHSMEPMASLADTPQQFKKGCHPESTRYCRSDQGRPISAPVTAPTYSSQSQSRQYGDATFVPGIAHVPTSYVDRSVENNQAVLNSGRTVPQSTRLGGMAPGYMMAQNTQNHTTHSYHGMHQGPAASDGSYWEQTSGPTMIGGMMATKVLCKRALPTQFARPAQVVRPVIGVPVPVPVTCAGVPIQGMNAQALHGHVPHAPIMAGGPPAGQNGWTY